MTAKKNQISRKIKILDRERTLKKQNELRAKYGLKPLKRIQLETFLYILNNDSNAPKERYISNNGGMYQ